MRKATSRATPSPVTFGRRPEYAESTCARSGNTMSGYSSRMPANIRSISSAVIGMSGDFMYLKRFASSRLVPMISGTGRARPFR